LKSVVQQLLPSPRIFLSSLLPLSCWSSTENTSHVCGKHAGSEVRNESGGGSSKRISGKLCVGALLTSIDQPGLIRNSSCSNCNSHHACFEHRRRELHLLTLRFRPAGGSREGKGRAGQKIFPGADLQEVYAGSNGWLGTWHIGH